MSLLDLDLQFRRGDFELQVQLALDAGVTGICGPSGAGKSTLLALLAGLLVPDSGSIRFAGTPLVDRAQHIWVPPWRRHFGWVFQDGMLFPHLSVRQNLLYGHARREAEHRRFELAAVVELLELQALLARRPGGLSGGERQRVALGRALLCSPRLLLLDEPLSALDPRMKSQILLYLQRVRDAFAIPMVYVSHVAQEVEFLATRILHLEQGRIRDPI